MISSRKRGCGGSLPCQVWCDPCRGIDADDPDSSPAANSASRGANIGSAVCVQGDASGYRDPGGCRWVDDVPALAVNASREGQVDIGGSDFDGGRVDRTDRCARRDVGL